MSMLKSLITTTAIASGIFLIGSASQPAYAQKGAFLAPTTQWSVNKVDAAQGKGDPYCSVARRFQRSLILTFARNERLESSIAIDFQSPVLNSARLMQVVLDPGAGQQRKYEIFPVSNSAFVVRLGHDEAFFGALEKTGYLRIEAGGQTYNFNLADIDLGQSKLQSCLTSVALPPVGSEQSAIAAQRSVSADNTLAIELKQLRADIQALQNENRNLANTLTQAKNIPAAVASAAPAVSAPPLTPSVDVGALARQLDELRRENDELRLELGDARHKNSELRNVMGKSGELDNLRSENNDLRIRLEQSQASSSRLSELQNELQALSNENERLKVQAQAKVVESNAEDAAKLLALQEEKAALEAKLEARASNEDAKSADVAALNAQIEALSGENTQLKESLQTSQTELAAAQELARENAQSAAEMVNASTEDIGRTDALSSEIENLKSQLAAKDKEMVELSSLSVEHEMLKEQNAVLTLQAEELRTMEETVAALHGEIDNLKAENEKLRAQSSDVAENATDQEEEKVEDVGAADLEILRLRTENEELKTKLSQKQDVEPAADDSAKEETIAALESELQALRAENESLKQQDEASAPQEDSSDMMQTLSLLEEDNMRLKTQLEQAQKDISEMPELRTRLAALEGENAVLKKQVSELQNALEAAKANYVPPSQEGVTAQPISTQAQSRIQELEQALQEAETDKQMAMQGLAREYMALKTHMARMRNNAADGAAAASLQEASYQIYQSTEGAVDVSEQGSADQVADIEPAAGEELQAEEEGDATTQALSDVIAQLREEDLSEPLPPVAAEARSEPPIVEEPLPAGLTEAQRQDAMLRRKIEDGVNENIAEAAEQILLQDTGVEPLEVRASEDPFADMDVQQDTVKAFALEGEDVVEELNPALPGPEQQHEIVTVPLEEETAAETPAPLAPSPAQDVAQGQGEMDSSVAQPPLSQAAAPAEEIPQARVYKDSRQNYVSTIPQDVYTADIQVAGLVEAAGIVPAQQVSLVKQASDLFTVAYQWQAGSVFGSSEQSGLTSQSGFDESVQRYLEKTQSRCKGDFAILPDRSMSSGPTRVDSYEIACVGANVSSSAALVFFNEGTTFNIIAHEAPTENLESAMSLRDKIVQTVTGTQGS